MLFLLPPLVQRKVSIISSIHKNGRKDVYMRSSIQGMEEDGDGEEEGGVSHRQPSAPVSL